MGKNLDKITSLLDVDEVILTSLECSIRTFIYRQVYRPGILVATNKRMIFYGLNLGDIELIEKFEYKGMRSIEEKDGILKKYIVIHTDSDTIRLSNILSDKTNEFIYTVKKQITYNA